MKFTNRKLTETIIMHPDSTMSDIGNYLGVTETTISSRTRKLLDSGELDKDSFEIVKSFFCSRSGNSSRKTKVNMKDFKDVYDEVVAGELTKKKLASFWILRIIPMSLTKRSWRLKLRLPISPTGAL